jgi:hypothetical protein
LDIAVATRAAVERGILPEFSPTVAMTRGRRTGITLGRLSNQRPNAALTAIPLKARVARKIPKLEWIHMPLVDREEC